MENHTPDADALQERHNLALYYTAQEHLQQTTAVNTRLLDVNDLIERFTNLADHALRDGWERVRVALKEVRELVSEERKAAERAFAKLAFPYPKGVSTTHPDVLSFDLTDPDTRLLIKCLHDHLQSFCKFAGYNEHVCVDHRIAQALSKFTKRP